MNQTLTAAPQTHVRQESERGPQAGIPGARKCRVAYIMSRFPKLTETFVLFEMQAVEQLSVKVEVFPLVGKFPSGQEVAGASPVRKLLDHLHAPTRPGLMHAEAAPYVDRAHYEPFVSFGIILANLLMFARRPLRYLATLAAVIRGSGGNANCLWGGLSIFPKCVYFARTFARAEIDHIHAHFANHPAVAAYIIHRFTGIPYSFTAHGSDLHRHKNMLRKKTEHAAFVVAVSDYNRQIIIDHCGPQCANRVHTIHCGVDVEKFRPAPARSPSPSPILQVVCVGTLHEVKGQIYLLQALSWLRSQGTPCHVHFVGDGKDLAVLSDMVRRESLTPFVTFHGTKTRDQLVELLQASDLLVAPSVPTSDGRREGIPIVLMEAMACGLPVVASRISGIPELVNSDQVGRLVAPKDIVGLARAISVFADDAQLRQRVSLQARQRIVEHFSVHKNAAALIALFENSGSLNS